MQTLRLMITWKLFLGRLQVDQLKSYGISPGRVHVKMSRRLRYLLRMSLSSIWLKPCPATCCTSWETPLVIIAFTFPKNSGKRSLHLITKSDHPCEWNSTGYIVALNVDETFLGGGIAFAIVIWQTGISPSHFLPNRTFVGISTTEWLLSKPQTTGGEKSFRLLSFARMGDGRT